MEFLTDAHVLSSDRVGSKDELTRWLHRAGLMEGRSPVGTYELQEGPAQAQAIEACVLAWIEATRTCRGRRVPDQPMNGRPVFIGDAIVGEFGATIVHEDDPERAVRAGLRILAAIEDLNADDPSLGVSV